MTSTQRMESLRGETLRLDRMQADNDRQWVEDLKSVNGFDTSARQAYISLLKSATLDRVQTYDRYMQRMAAALAEISAQKTFQVTSLDHVSEDHEWDSEDMSDTAEPGTDDEEDDGVEDAADAIDRVHIAADDDVHC